MERREAALQIGSEIADVLQSNMKAHRRSLGLPRRCRTERRAVERDDETLEAAPRGADTEQRQRIDEGVCCLLGHRLEHDAEQAGRAGEIALPQRMTRIGLQSRMQYARDFGARLEPFGNG